MRYSLLILSTLALAIMLCTQSGSEIASYNMGGSEITGYLVTGDGSPAANATVCLKIIMSSDSVFKTIDSTITDKNGRYIFNKKVTNDPYTLYATRSKDSLACIHFNLIYSIDNPPVDTLKGMGKIYATAFLANSQNNQGIVVCIPGTSFRSETDSLGNATIWYVPHGDYNVQFKCNGYITKSELTHVAAGMTDTIGPVTLERDQTVALPIPVPTGLKATADTLLGIVTVTWDTSAITIQKYDIRIFDNPLDNYTNRTESHYCTGRLFIDTVFNRNTPDTITSKVRVYQVSIENITGNQGQWGERCSLLVKKPVIPPPPICSLLTTPESLSISLSARLPDLWWIDSLIINRFVGSDSQSSYRTALPYSKIIFWKDNFSNMPQKTDNMITVTYSACAKSIYGYLSAPSSPLETVISNPYYTYVMTRPQPPQGLPSEGAAGIFQTTVPCVNSPIPDDITEYRIVITRSDDSSPFYTEWYTSQEIDVSLNSECTWFLQSQARSRSFPCALSQLSDTCKVIIHQAHRVDKPSTPVGISHIVHGNPGQYISTLSDTCSKGHQVSIRYVLSYQDEIASDSTGWLPLSSSATIYWSKPGIGYLRAQARCETNPLIVSPWSDALVVTVE